MAAQWLGERHVLANRMAPDPERGTRSRRASAQPEYGPVRSRSVCVGIANYFRDGTDGPTS